MCASESKTRERRTRKFPAACSAISRRLAWIHSWSASVVFMLWLLLFLCTISVSLNGTHTGNGTEEFVGFMIYVYNQFEDEESGHFVKPLPEGVSMTECHLNARSYIVRRKSVCQLSVNVGVYKSRPMCIYVLRHGQRSRRSTRSIRS